MPVEQDVVRDRRLDPLELADQEVGQRLDVLDRLCFLVVYLFQVYECIDDQLHDLPLHDEHVLAVSQHLQQFLERNLPFDVELSLLIRLFRQRAHEA